MRFSSLRLLLPAFFALVVSAAPTKMTTSTSLTEPEPPRSRIFLPATEAISFANNLNVAIAKVNEDKSRAVDPLKSSKSSSKTQGLPNLGALLPITRKAKANGDNSRALVPLNSSSNVGGLVPITGKKTWIGEDNGVVTCMERLPGMGYAMAAVYISYGKNEECVRSMIRCTGGTCRFVVIKAAKVLPALPVQLAAGSAGAILGEIVESKLADKFISDREQRKMCFQVTADAGAILLSALRGAAYNGAHIGFRIGYTKAMADPRVQATITTVASKVNIPDLAKVALPYASRLPSKKSP